MTGSATGSATGDPAGTVSWKMLLQQGAVALEAALGGNRRREASWIVERVSGYSATELFRLGDELVTTRGVAFFDQLVARRAAGEPLQYVLGRWSFRSLELLVDPRVLIPRPETEVVAGFGIEHLCTYDRPVRAVDLGCGSGAIGLSIAVEVPASQVWLSDVSLDALAVAQANVSGLGRAGARVTTCTGSWFDGLPQELRATFDLVISNPPYVARTAEIEQVVVDWEPHVALFGPGDPGDGFLRTIVSEAGQWLAPGGALVLEMGPDQTDAIAEACKAVGLSARIEPDAAGRPRAVVAVDPRPRT
jgi:release factor glutamine methyltransferase